MFKALEIDLKELIDPSQILKIVKTAGFKTYNYQFTDNHGRVLKFGIQYSSSRQLGERVYRQAANLKGWGKPLPYSSSGMSMRSVAENYKKRYGVDLIKSNVKITLWDQTNDQLSSSEMRIKCEAFERNLIKSHIDANGEAPVGNNERSTYKLLKAKQNSAIVKELFS